MLLLLVFCVALGLKNEVNKLLRNVKNIIAKVRNKSEQFGEEQSTCPIKYENEIKTSAYSFTVLHWHLPLIRTSHIVKKNTLYLTNTRTQKKKRRAASIMKRKIPIQVGQE